MDRAVTWACQDPPADLILATDPDADRLGAMIPLRLGASIPEEWRYTNGNEIAALLTHFKLSQLKEQGRLPRSPLVVTTEVTTRLITRIAQRFGCQVVDHLLVGFKYVADVLAQLEKSGRFGDIAGTPADLVIACEESHGILVTAEIRDKDAAGAALLLAEIAVLQKRRGQTVSDYLEQIYREFGYHRNELRTVAMTGIMGKQQMRAMLESLRSAPPEVIAEMGVTAVVDLLREDGWLGPHKGATDAAGRNFLVFRLGPHARVALRPSGTESKAKVYLEVSTAPLGYQETAAEWRARCAAVDDRAQKLGRDFVHLALARIGLNPLS
jgi:phosphoglucomutase/phosphomannomutase